MKPAPFAYHQPDTIEEALATLAEYGPEARVLAGGQSLLPLMSTRAVQPAVLVDINRLGAALNSDPTPDQARSASVSIDALVRQNLDPVLRAELPLLAAAVVHVGHVQTRHRGTICGSLAHGDPMAEIGLALLVLGGQVELRNSHRSRHLRIDEFLVGEAFSTARQDDELLVRSHWDRLPVGAGFGFEELANGTTLAAAAAVVEADGDRITRARVGVVGPMEGASAIEVTEDAGPEDIAATLTRELAFMDDHAADARYRRSLATELAVRALVTARERAQ